MELKLELELAIVSTTRDNIKEIDNVVFVTCLVSKVLCKVLLEMLLLLEKTKLEETKLEKTELEETKLDNIALKTWGGLLFNPYIFARAVLLTL